MHLLAAPCSFLFKMNGEWTLLMGLQGGKAGGLSSWLKSLTQHTSGEYFPALLCDNRVQLLISYKVLLV